MIITPHPLIPLPTEDDLKLLHSQKGDKGVHELLEAREARIKQANEDPLNHGFQLEGWKHVDKFLETVDTVFVSGGKSVSCWRTAYLQG